MEELIAKRYIKALKEGSDLASMENMTTVFSVLSESFKNDKFINIIANPSVKAEEKTKILLDSVKLAESQAINNLIRLLVENKRIGIIPAIAKELKNDLAKSTKNYNGIICSNKDINTKIVSELSASLSKKYDAAISLSFIQNDFNGIKVEVEGLGIEISLSKDRIDGQIIEHIIKAI